MNNQEKKIVVFLIGLPAVIFAFFIGVYVGGGEGGARPSHVDDSMVSQEMFEPFWRAWAILDDKYVESASTTAQDRVWGAIQGLASAYGDPYTVFLPPVEAKQFEEDISGNFEGVGMELGIRNKQLQVVAPIKNSPAERAGVKAGDVILKIGEQSAIDMPVDAAVKLIRGKKGTPVTITFLPSGSSKPVEKTLIRDIIDIPTLETSMKNGVFVIRLFSFTAQSPNLFRNALREFILSGSDKLVLDLRGNPGGYLDAAWDMASYFLPGGTVVVTEDFGDKGSPRIYRSKGYNVFGPRLKMVVLVDGGSASASEILAGALSENGVAKLVGSKTFGKGSVQQLISLTPETSLKVTIARWLTPTGHNLSHDGLTPDYPVEVTEADVLAGKDPALDRAVQLLSNGAI